MCEGSRVEIARELHDGIAQDLVALTYRLDLLIGAGQVTSSQLISFRLALSELLVKVRDEIFLLRSYNSFEEELREIISTFPSEITVSLTLDTLPDAVHDKELLAILRELTINTLKHSGATHVEVLLYEREGKLLCEYRDNGVGGDLHRNLAFGIQGIRERVASLDGTCVISGANGISVWISLPK